MRTTVRVLFLASVILAAVLYAALSVRDYAAYRHAATGTPEGLSAACDVQPENADYWRALGAYQLFSSSSTERALTSARRAAQLNPWSARTWLLIAGIHQVLGDQDGQAQALRAAIDADPRTPDVAWEVANFFLVRGESVKALPLFRPVVENDPGRAPAVYRLCWRSTHDLQAILRESTPHTAAAHLQLLGVLAEDNELAAAAHVWSRIVALGQQVEPAGAYKYFDFLITRRQVAQAQQVSDDIESLNGTADMRRNGNFIVNGDFEQHILNRGFDWRYTAVPGAKLSIDYSERRSGTQSLMVQFDGHPGDLGLFQYVPVEPGKHYELTAFVRWQDISTSSGPRLGVVDAYTGQQYAITEDLLESGVWREISADFTAPPDARLGIVKLLRAPSAPLIKGDLWLDDVRMTQR